MSPRAVTEVTFDELGNLQIAGLDDKRPPMARRECARYGTIERMSHLKSGAEVRELPRHEQAAFREGTDGERLA
jgi:hypothetical protein